MISSARAERGGEASHTRASGQTRTASSNFRQLAIELRPPKNIRRIKNPSPAAFLSFAAHPHRPRAFGTHKAGATAYPKKRGTFVTSLNAQRIIPFSLAVKRRFHVENKNVAYSPGEEPPLYGVPGILGLRDASPRLASASTTWYWSRVVAVACWYFSSAVT